MLQPVQMQWQLAPNLAEIDRVIAESGLMFERCQLHPRDRFGLTLLLREALTNAILHGCRLAAAGMITCRLHWQMGPSCPQMMIEVIDPGPGFDWRQSLTRGCKLIEQAYLCNEPLPEKSRGLIIYIKYATSYQFNESGNQIILLRDLEKGNGNYE
jgi:anti-sigma regulatory factor (Ser/Thr protein kinase)